MDRYAVVRSIVSVEAAPGQQTHPHPLLFARRHLFSDGPLYGPVFH